MKRLPRVFVGIIVFMVSVGFVFPMLLSGMANLMFPLQAQGSLIVEETTVRGSYLIGQNFTQKNELWGRPSANDYQTSISGSSNLSVSSDSYKQIMIERIAFIRSNHPSMMNKDVPIDLVTESSSGLDPHISVESAMYQIDRLVEYTNQDYETIKSIIYKCTKDGNVNVLEVNLALRSLQVGKQS